MLVVTVGMLLIGCAPAVRSSLASSTAVAQSSVAKSTAPLATAPPKGRPLDELLLFYPVKYPDGQWYPSGLIWDDAWFTASDGTKLHGWYCPCPNPRAVVLYVHGNAGNLSYRSQLMRYMQNELRVTALIFDYRGFGRSQGSPSVAGILQDARAARQFLAIRAKIKESQIVLCGESLGGAVAVDLASEDGARGLILGNTFSSLKEIAVHHYPKLAWMIPANKLDSLSRIGKYKGPLLQCHGDADRMIPFEQGVKLFDAATGRKKFIKMPGNDHRDALSEEYYTALNQFLDELPKE